jgi:hypothetical protein
LDIKQLKTEIAEAEKEAQRQNPVVAEKPLLEADALEKIKATLNPKFSEKKQKQIFVPEEAEKMVGVIIENMTEKDIITTEVINIHYGKKFRFTLGQRQAEVNLFYGKKGYTAVIAPRNGTNAEFNQVCWQIISEMFLQ